MNPELSQSYQDIFILGILKGKYVRMLGKTHFFLFVLTLPVECEEI